MIYTKTVESSVTPLKARDLAVTLVQKDFKSTWSVQGYEEKCLEKIQNRTSSALCHNN